MSKHQTIALSKEDIMGKSIVPYTTYNNFKAIKVISPKGSKNKVWLCECQICGGRSKVNACNLGKTDNCKSCRGLKHGMSRSATYTAWCNMISRCRDSKNPAFKNYGGRGIKVCDRWMKFTNFLDDMGEKPKGLSLDRIDNQRGYFPDNCRWVEWKHQMRNRRCKGVHKQGSSWIAKIVRNYKNIYLGSFTTEAEAKAAYEKAKKKIDQSPNIL
jgi:hypothetical protein